MFLTKHSFSLEIKLQSKLNNSSIAGGENLSKPGAVARNIRRSEIGAVEGIKELGSELEAHPFGDAEVLCEREIEVHKTGSSHNPHAGIAKSLR